MLCRRVVRGFVPACILTRGTSLARLSRALPAACAKHVYKTPVLWLTRASREQIARTHIADLRGRYHVGRLSLLELRAIWQSLPESFEVDGDGAKAQWPLRRLFFKDQVWAIWNVSLRVSYAILSRRESRDLGLGDVLDRSSAVRVLFPKHITIVCESDTNDISG